MKPTSILFLQSVIVLVGAAALALLIWMPQLEGVNANKAFLEVYLDPFVWLVYAGSVPFFIALHQAFKVLGYAGQDDVFRQEAVKSLRIVKVCALAIVGFVVAEELFIMLNHGDDDAAGAFMMGIVISFASVVIAVSAAVFEKILQGAVRLKSENDLTV